MTSRKERRRQRAIQRFLTAAQEGFEERLRQWVWELEFNSWVRPIELTEHAPSLTYDGSRVQHEAPERSPHPEDLMAYSDADAASKKKILGNPSNASTDVRKQKQAPIQTKDPRCGPPKKGKKSSKAAKLG